MYARQNDPTQPVFWTVDGLFTRDECAALVARIDAEPRATATINAGGHHVLRPDVRNNTRVMFDDEAYAAELWPRLRPHVPEELRGRVAVGLNERFRCYRYEAGQRFAAHYDGAFIRDDDEASELTVMVYLNEGMTGGDTVFLDFEEAITPRTGRVLFFEHCVLHEGAPVTAGLKFVLRSDVMYRTERG